MNEIEPISILVPNQVLHVEWPIFSGDTKFQHSLKKWFNICRFHQQNSFRPCVGGSGRRMVDSTFGLKNFNQVRLSRMSCFKEIYTGEFRLLLREWRNIIKVVKGHDKRRLKHKASAGTAPPPPSRSIQTHTQANGEMLVHRRDLSSQYPQLSRERQDEVSRIELPCDGILRNSKE